MISADLMLAVRGGRPHRRFGQGTEVIKDINEHLRMGQSFCSSWLVASQYSQNNVYNVSILCVHLRADVGRDSS